MDERVEKKVETGIETRTGVSRSGRALGNLRTFSSLKNRVYRFYYAGMLGQMASMNMQQIASGLLLERLTGSPAIVGLMSLANAIPMLVFSLFGGVIADRIEKKLMLILGQAAFAVLSLGVAIALNVDYLSAARQGSWWILVLSSGLPRRRHETCHAIAGGHHQ